uniref:hypothetical protein n=4 Tax=Pseudomonadota TaxID=1224 RepID=UPI001ABFCB89
GLGWGRLSGPGRRREHIGQRQSGTGGTGPQKLFALLKQDRPLAAIPPVLISKDRRDGVFLAAICVDMTG